MRKSDVIKRTMVVLASAVLMSGCMGGPTPEEQKMQDEYRAQMIKMMQQQMSQGLSQPEQQVTPVAVKSPMTIITEDELLSKTVSFDATTSGVKFTKFQDGFSINDAARFMDYEGQIINYGYDWKSGDVTYMIEVAPKEYKIKYTRALSSQSPIDIATVTQNGRMLNIRTVTGKKLNSKGIILTSRGFITLRNATAFQYTLGKGITSFAAPEGWHIARFQNGDIASTNYILLEKNSVATDDGGIADLIDSTKSVMSSFGLTDKTDYMLVNMSNPTQQNLLDIDLSDKDLATYSQCERMNSYVQKCDNVNFSESLYDHNGLINQGHYYWRVMWYKTNSGKILSITKEATHKKVIITDLTTGKKVEAAYRITGFATLESTQDATGKIKIIAGGGLFSDEVIEDAEALFMTAKQDKE